MKEAVRRECEESRGEEKKCPNWTRAPVYRADGREDSPHRAPARRATVIGVDTPDTVTHESPMSDRLATVRTLSPPAPVGAHVTIHTRRMTKRMHAL